MALLSFCFVEPFSVGNPSEAPAIDYWSKFRHIWPLDVQAYTKMVETIF